MREVGAMASVPDAFQTVAELKIDVANYQQKQEADLLSSSEQTESFRKKTDARFDKVENSVEDSVMDARKKRGAVEESALKVLEAVTKKGKGTGTEGSSNTAGWAASPA